MQFSHLIMSYSADLRQDLSSLIFLTAGVVWWEQLSANNVFFFLLSPSPEWPQQRSDPQWDLLQPWLPEGQAVCAGGSPVLQIL